MIVCVQISHFLVYFGQTLNYNIDYVIILLFFSHFILHQSGPLQHYSISISSLSLSLSNINDQLSVSPRLSLSQLLLPVSSQFPILLCTKLAQISFWDLEAKHNDSRSRQSRKLRGREIHQSLEAPDRFVHLRLLD